jgi:hypothetical protein
MNRADRRARLAIERRRGGRPPAHSGTALRALTASALALPGLAHEALADAPVARPSASYAFSFYKEDNLSPGNWSEASGGSRERYEIFAQQFNVIAPMTARSDVAVDFVYESMAGASPWFVIDAGGVPLQAMTGATIEDSRADGQVTPSLYFDTGRLSLSGGFSTEKDYLSGNFGFSGQRHYNDKNTTFDAGLSFGWDEITPTDATQYGRVQFAEKKTISLLFGFAQVLHRTAVAQLTLGYKNSDGFLSDPYKEIFVGPNRRFDKRPSQRDQLTLLLRYRQHVPAASASLHFDYGFYWDNWDVSSHTFELSWFQDLFEFVKLVPNFRYYSQSEAFFYKPFYPTGSNPSFYSSDYRLSPYGAISYGLKAEASLSGWPHRRVDTVFSLAYDRYASSGDWALGNVAVEAPGLVKYRLYSFRVGGRF